MDLNALYDINQNGLHSQSIRDFQKLQSLLPKHDFQVRAPNSSTFMRLTIVLRGLCRKNTYLKNIAQYQAYDKYSKFNSPCYILAVWIHSFILMCHSHSWYWVGLLGVAIRIEKEQWEKSCFISLSSLPSVIISSYDETILSPQRDITCSEWSKKKKIGNIWLEFLFSFFQVGKNLNNSNAFLK